LRYVGQGYELKIPFPAGIVGEQDLAAVWERFHKAHAREYGHAFAGSPIEIVNLRVVGIGQMPKIAKLVAPEGTTLDEARVRTGQCVFRIDGELRAFETGFYRRHLLPVGKVFAGPAIVLQKDSTTVIPPGCSAINDPAGNLILTIAMDD
jgi:N-methylhydantoinase A